MFLHLSSLFFILDLSNYRLGLCLAEKIFLAGWLTISILSKEFGKLLINFRHALYQEMVDAKAAAKQTDSVTDKQVDREIGGAGAAL